MSRGCLLKLAALLVCARAYEDSESNPGITDEKNGAREVIGELDYPLKISCVASEKPPPFVFWSHKTRSSAWLIKDSEYEETGNTLLIRSLATETLGQYTCQVYSLKGLEAPRVFNVRAYKPNGDISGGEWLVPRDAVSPIPETTSTATWTTTEDLGKTDKLELELAASEGDQITLHCLLDSTLMAGDPLPKVTWKFGGVTIDGTAGRYRVTSDGALQIVSLYRNDTGVYTCEPDDTLGEASHDIHLLVNDPVPIPPGIAGEDNATVTGELDQPLHVRCLVYGYPNPSVLWSRDDEVDIVLYNNSIYEVTANILVIRSLSPDTLGPYTCRAFNEEGMASWRVVVQAYRPDGLLSGDLWFVPRDTKAPRPTTQASITTNKWLFTGSSIISKFTEVTKEVAASFDKSGDNTNNTSSTTIIPTISTTAVIGLSTLNDERTTSESSTTDEGSVTAEGTTDFLGTTTLDPCSDFQFGCCADNETEASGPEGQGCPCNTTEFGCCPDGVNPISGPDNEGCPGTCSTTPHGCCQDGKTPAHGPEFEGCCLLQAFGCCPDNRKPAEGPHLEGCGCQYALYGCCPDNVTIAQGPDHLGCGCQYTQHGCCLDRHTPASGPNKEGCACNTYQFGCCPDGITVAEGPDQLGCHCRDSKFGCCGDGETAATGPDAAGCDCSSSRYGCCPDGRTEAAGPKFLGCTDAPENKQAACSLLTDPGPCHNFTPMWYFDMAYGGCSRFWYGGCDGNGNRFSTKADCEDVCIQPSPKDACKLPSVKGACDSDYQRWHYNSTREQCIPFRYGGCLGNANNFDTRELCQKQCEPSSVAGQCGLPIDQGSCAGNYSRWGFNPETRRCEQFIWGGCEGNSNRFRSEAACQMRCAGTTPPECTQPQEAGNCGEKEALWSFSQSENRCLPFYYSGCGGNDNRFGSREACEQICPSAYVPDKCTLPAETGQCSNYREKWFYHTTSKRCRQFYYGGCGGNENNFATEAECDNNCSEVKTTTISTTTTTAATTAKPDKTGSVVPERSEFCFNVIDAGPCKNMETRYAYDSELGRCVTFQYGGCGGNQNNFPDENYCSYYCQPVQDICQLPMLQGPCEESLMRWFYDASTDSCSQFMYGGCEGNENSFESLEACENRCRTGPAPAAPTTPTTTSIVSGPSECSVPESLEECRYGGPVWYFDVSNQECVSHFNQESGVNCRYTGTFPSEEACERSCGVFLGVDVCKQPLDPGPCQSYVPKVYFDQSTGQCHEFIYGGCLGGANRFSSFKECSQVCKTEIEVCSLPPDQGNCSLNVKQWYYNATSHECYQFAYTGCSGNDNRFDTERDCEARCKRPASTTTTVALRPQQQPTEPECRTPSSLAPCGHNVTVFYYNSERAQCLVSGFGGCGHANTYSTEEECERRCGAFRGINVCGVRLDPGPCRASIPKFYWDVASGSCQPYAYGGCAGGPNRFSTVEECMDLCGATGPDSDQMLPPDCTPYQQECEALDCPYGVDRFTQDECQRCECREDPCIRADCQPTERCEAVAIRNAVSQEPEYSAKCVYENTEVHQCDEYVANCSRLRCEYGIQRTRQHDGCEQCSCVQVESDCEPLQQECTQLQCRYGIERVTGSDGCERCKCKEYPCERKSCAAGERCVVLQYRDGINSQPQFAAECRTILKAGGCPMDETTTNEVTCRRECADDADCRGVGKCCRRGCSDVCLAPVEQTSPRPLLTTTTASNVPAAPVALPQPEPQVAASEGGTATLRCLFHGNPPPQIAWRFGELTIDGTAGRYRVTSDGALQIVSLYRSDTGVYTCEPDDALGEASHDIHLLVNDPVRTPAGIAGDENAVVTGELGQPLQVRCLAYGYPPPAAIWYRYDGTMIPYHDAVYETKKNDLLIKSLAIETLG
ncbi:hypothetical protein PYW07_008093 [Mythimna separata]|uniref:Papilin n=1 Tax=Mythimna separata TaxID=271217 RepID=A0AAD8DVJ3_MYTSE|nr:hypothetical protein PYW07_008093 [Mythimna separata]